MPAWVVWASTFATYRERLRAAWTILRGRASEIEVSYGERSRRFIAVERAK